MSDETVLVIPDFTGDVDYVCETFNGTGVCQAQCKTCPLESEDRYAKYKAQQEQGK